MRARSAPRDWKTRSACAHVGPSAVPDHIRHLGMIFGMPIRHEEQVALLGNREACGAVGNVLRGAVIVRGLEIRGPRIGPGRK